MQNDPVGRCVADLVRRKKNVIFARTLLAAGTALSFLAGAVFLAAVLLFPAAFNAGAVPWTGIEILLMVLAAFGAAWAAALLVAIVRTIFAGQDTLRAAKHLDDCYALKDQVASAVDLAKVDRRFAVEAGKRAVRLVDGKDARAVFPLRIPRAAALAAVAAVLFVLGAVFYFPPAKAVEKPLPGITDLAEKLRRFALNREKEARSNEEKEIIKKLKKLAQELKKKKTTKKKALEEVARLKKMLGKKAQELRMKGMNLRKIADALDKSKHTRPAAKQFRKRNVKKAADSLGELSKQIHDRDALKENREFKELSGAFQEASRHMGPFRRSAEKVSDAAKFFERQKTARELEQLSKGLAKNAEAAELSDMLSDSMQELEEMQEGLGGIKEFKQGNKGDRFMNSQNAGQGGRQGMKDGTSGRKGGRKGDKKGGRTLGAMRKKDLERGTHAGRGTNSNLFGKPSERKKADDPYMARALEGKGKSKYFQVKSAREMAESSVENKNLFTKYVRMVEETIHDERIPIGYREYVKRYFENIRPAEDRPDRDD